MGKCIICGKEFTPYHGSKDQNTCSKECRKIRNNANLRRKYHENIEQSRLETREYQRKHRKGMVKCMICGEPVYRCWNDPDCKKNSRLHDGCVYDEIIETLAAGIQLTTKQRSRLSQRGYNRERFIEEFKDEITEAHQVQTADK